MNRQTPEWFVRADNFIMRIYKYVSYVATLCLIAIMLIAVINVCGEKLAQAGASVKGINFSADWIAYLHVPVVFLSTGYIALERGHTCVDILTNKLHAVVRRIMAYVSAVLGIAITGFIAWRGITALIPDLIEHHMTISTSSFSFVQWPFALTYCIGMLMLCFGFFWIVLRLIFNYAPPVPGDPTLAPDSEIMEGGPEV